MDAPFPDDNGWQNFDASLSKPVRINSEFLSKLDEHYIPADAQALQEQIQRTRDDYLRALVATNPDAAKVKQTLRTALAHAHSGGGGRRRSRPRPHPRSKRTQGGGFDEAAFKASNGRLRQLAKDHEAYMQLLKKEPAFDPTNVPLPLSDYLRFDLEARMHVQPYMDQWAPVILEQIKAIHNVSVITGGTHATQRFPNYASIMASSEDGRLFVNHRSRLELYVLHTDPRTVVRAICEKIQALFIPDCVFKQGAGATEAPAQTGAYSITNVGRFTETRSSKMTLDNDCKFTFDDNTVANDLHVNAGARWVSLKAPGGKIVGVKDRLQVEKRHDNNFRIKLTPTKLELFWQKWSILIVNAIDVSSSAQPEPHKMLRELQGFEWVDADGFLTCKGKLAVDAKADATPFNKNIERELVNKALIATMTPDAMNAHYNAIAGDVLAARLWPDACYVAKHCINITTKMFDGLQAAFFNELQPDMFAYIAGLDLVLRTKFNGSRCALGGGAAITLYDVTLTTPIDDYDVSVFPFHGVNIGDLRDAIAEYTEMFFMHLQQRGPLTLNGTVHTPKYQFRYAAPRVYHGVHLLSMDAQLQLKNLVLAGQDCGNASMIISFLDVVIYESKTFSHADIDEMVTEWPIRQGVRVPILTLKKINFNLRTMIIADRLNKIMKDVRRIVSVNALFEAINALCSPGTPMTTIPSKTQYMLVHPAIPDWSIPHGTRNFLTLASGDTGKNCLALVTPPVNDAASAFTATASYVAAKFRKECVHAESAQGTGKYSTDFIARSSPPAASAAPKAKATSRVRTAPAPASAAARNTNTNTKKRTKKVSSRPTTASASKKKKPQTQYLAYVRGW